MVQWYPGHMKKARDEITRVLPKVDVVIEIRDARLPVSSSNPVLKELILEKPCLRLLSKKDLADPDVTAQWISVFEKEKNIRTIDIETRDRAIGNIIINLCRKISPPKRRRPIRAMIVGIPNVGKSTLLNTLAGRRMAHVENKPAITRSQQMLSLKKGSDRLDILDTPGLLWPDLDDRDGSLRIAASGAIKDSIVDLREIAYFVADYIIKHYPLLPVRRYGLETLPDTPEALIEEIGRTKGCLLKGGIVDEYKASEKFIQDFRTGQLGRISLEAPEDHDETLNRICFESVQTTQ